MHKAQKLINHVVIVLDASYSMKGKEKNLIRATNDQIQHLAKRSKELDQETRVSIYHFGQRTIDCLIFDMDVMRLPGIEDLYSVLRENTALIDAVLKSQEDLETTSQLYGDHAFLTFILTDGDENSSRRQAKELQDKIFNAPLNWSLGFLVPNQYGVRYLENLGVLRDSIAIWDTAGTAGLDTAVSAIRTATDNFMNNRSKGVRGTRSVFSTGADAVNTQTVTEALVPMSQTKYGIYSVPTDSRIDDTIRSITGTYKIGSGYYQLTKTETIQPQKEIIVVEKSTGQAYTGQAARGLIGLPAKAVRVKPDFNPAYDIYVQSTSVNRKLLAGKNVLVKY